MGAGTVVLARRIVLRSTVRRMRWKGEGEGFVQLGLAGAPEAGRAWTVSGRGIPQRRDVDVAGEQDRTRRTTRSGRSRLVADS